MSYFILYEGINLFVSSFFLNNDSHYIYIIRLVLCILGKENHDYFFESQFQNGLESSSLEFPRSDSKELDQKG